jgi:hypothetical protein
MSVLYSYLKSVNAARLEKEIKDSAIITALDYITVFESNISIYFKAELSTEDEAILDSIIDSHINEPLPVVDERRNSKGAIIVDTTTQFGLSGAQSITLNSHDWGDRTTWYQRSVSVSGDVLVDSGDGFIFNSSNQNWVNMDSMNLTYDYKIVPERDGTFSDRSLRRPVVTSNGELMNLCVNKSMTGPNDYQVNFATGQVHFNSSQSGKSVVANYWHNNNVPRASEWILCPPVNHAYLLKYVELQFSDTVQFSNGIHIEVWAGGNAYGPVPAVYGDFTQQAYDLGFGINASFYRGPKDFLNICTNRSSMTLPAFGGMTNDVLVFPFDYLVDSQIRSAYGVVLMLALENDIPFQNCELATATFYMQLVPEASLG